MDMVAGTEQCDCGHMESPHSTFTRGYGTDAQGKTFCYACCAQNDLKTMKEDGKWTGYLSKDGHGEWKVSNWPSSLVFKPYYVREWKASMWGGYQSAATAYFIGPDGFVWSATQKGNHNQIARCRRTKDKVKGVN